MLSIFDIFCLNDIEQYGLFDDLYNFIEENDNGFSVFYEWLDNDYLYYFDLFNYELYALYDGDSIIAIFYINIFDTYIILENILVKESYRNKGILKLILSFLKYNFGNIEISLYVDTDNINAICSYLHNDFIICGFLYNYYNDGGNALYMVLNGDDND